jgi:anti-sigma factor ChrR (cupin superfamily)
LGAERLHDAVRELPLRYAPFFGRLAELWEAPEQVVQSELSRAKDPKAWSFGLLPGLRTFDVAVGAERSAARARLLRFDPGAHFPKHRHRDTERVLVLEGAYIDGSGLAVHAGDEQTLSQGSEHELHILPGSPCVAAVSEHGIDFTGRWLRWVNLLLR